MKKLIKFYDSIDTKLSTMQFGNYGSFINIIDKLVTGDGFNPVEINKIIKVDGKKEVLFYFKTAGNYNHKLFEIVNLKENSQQEYSILEVNNDYLKCEYFDDYNISTNETYTGELVNSSFGFTKESNIDGKLVISDEYKVAKYTFYDVATTNFKNTDNNKVVGMYMTSYLDPAIIAPKIKSTIDYNNTPDWAMSDNNQVVRRCVMNLLYRANLRYVIIGNGNFVYFIAGQDSTSSYITYCFGVYTPYDKTFKYNSLMVSKSIGWFDTRNTPVNANYMYDEFNSRGSGNFNAMFDRMTFGQSPNSTGDGANLLCSNSVSDTSSNPFFLDSYRCTQLLYGYNTPSCFTLAPNMFFPSSTTNSGATMKAGDSLIPYPSNNKMLLSSINIIGGTNIVGNNTQYLQGKMPLMFWYGHAKSTSSGNLLPITINDNGKLRRFLVVNSYSTSNAGANTLMYFEITPNGYDNYYKG